VASRKRWTETSKPAATIADATTPPPTVPRLYRPDRRLIAG
jgi:hypothetical protein